MFKRLIFDDWVAIFPLIAFLTALSVYLSFSYRALTMRRSQRDQLANLPFNDEPASRHDHAEQP